MGYMVSFLFALLCFPALLVGFVLLDEWHKRKAWRDAEKFATDYIESNRSGVDNARRNTNTALHGVRGDAGQSK